MTTNNTPARPSTARKPQDRRQKATPARSTTPAPDETTGPVRSELDGDTWSFTTDDGATWHESRSLTDVFTPRWARLNRRRDDMDAIYTAIEEAFDGDDEAMDAWDSLTFKDQGRLGMQLFQAMGASLGE